MNLQILDPVQLMHDVPAITLKQTSYL